MKLTERRAMLYLPEDLYQRAMTAARRQRRSLAGLVREALKRYLRSPHPSDYANSIQFAFGIWKDKRLSGTRYEDKLRQAWKRKSKASD